MKKYIKSLILINFFSFTGLINLYSQNNGTSTKKTVNQVKPAVAESEIPGALTYSGSYTVGESEGTATYKYTEDSLGNRILNGKFTYSGKIGGKLIETISGYYKNNLKVGYWIYNTKTVPGIRTVSDQKFFGSYKAGYPDGLWTLNSLTQFTDGTVHQGKSLTGTTISIKGTANYKNKHLYGALSLENIQTGDNLKPLIVKGSFDENGLMDGKWIVRFASRTNGPIKELTVDYKNGVRYHMREVDTRTGEAQNKDLSGLLKILPLTYDTLTNLYISSNYSIYQAQYEEGKPSEYGDILTQVRKYFYKKNGEDHYHVNTKGCKDGSYFYFISIDTTKVKGNQLAIDAENEGNLRKAAKIYSYLIASVPESASLNYRNLSWVNCKLGNFIENINICKEGLKVATKDDRNVIIKNLGHSYLLSNQYEEAKKCYVEVLFEKNDNYYQWIYNNLELLKENGFSSNDCAKILNELYIIRENGK